ESHERLARLEIPSFIFDAQPDDAVPGLLSQSAVRLGSEMHVGASKAPEIAGPARPLTDLLDDVFEAFAWAAGDQPQKGPSSRLQGRPNRGKCRLLLQNPVQGIEGNDEVEFVPVGQTASVGDLKAEVRVSWRTEPARRECNHIVRRIDAEH